ncbi:hypothetical protein C0991_008970 [Blastosporella zonata]|nr:hypothetical protein C0991_008970 [Blastosporella zonata]
MPSPLIHSFRNLTREQGTFSKEKHEILFSRFQVNYNQIDQRYRKGSVLVREEITEPPAAIEPTEPPDSTAENKNRKSKREVKPKTRVIVLHCDIIKDEFWGARSGILKE